MSTRTVTLKRVMPGRVTVGVELGGGSYGFMLDDDTFFRTFGLLPTNIFASCTEVSAKVSMKLVSDAPAKPVSDA